MLPPARLTLLMCAAEALGMTGFAAYPSFLPLLAGVWQLSGAEAGLIGGAFFFGYMVAVPFLSGVTDRVDARIVYVASCVLMAGGTLGFALFARGMWTGAFFQALCGAGLAGCYMPGLRVLTDRVSTARSNRPIAFYTASFGIGTSLSLLLAGALGNLMDWRIAIALMAAGPLLAAVIVFMGTAPHAPPGAADAHWLPRFGPVLAHPRVRQLVTGYAVHCWELFGLRSWMVAFIAFAYGLSSAQAALSPTEAAALINLLGLPASILGNEMAGRVGRRRWIVAMMIASGLLCWLAGASAALPWWLMLCVLALYNTAVMADSASLTAGLVHAAPAAQRGAAMALYSLGGFGAGFIAPLVFGGVLDMTGGITSPVAWTFACGTLGVGCLLWALSALRRPARAA
ncbi:MAG: MFS transporter [Methyloversatilis sp.]|uniref:MFS transporter n=1 Tax=Methyloversatilis sp. TaxID=2569862 RepID=UPI0027358B23|nr:MFS transporter [Methyloversatilis sp.]MDP3873832.1 MFS transporter [Methyloversatilis sp.]